jgi:peptidoglycan L-alanyl-D-glutamate endopeptidase CwlK
VIDLVEILQPRAMLFATKMAEQGLPFMFTRTRCTQVEQNALYAQGRTTPGRIVTWTLNSMHLYGKAFDIAILKDGKPTWDPKVDVDGDSAWDYYEAGQLGESIGLVWGGRWKKPDYPHFQLKEAA